MKFNKIRTRRGKLERKIQVELTKPKPNIQYILSAIEDFEKDNLDTIEKLKRSKTYDSRKISGALKSTIAAHGPITKVLIGSATKRIYGSLLDVSGKPIENDRLENVKKVLNVLAWWGLVFFIIKFIISIA